MSSSCKVLPYASIKILLSFFYALFFFETVKILNELQGFYHMLVLRFC